jgi:DNA-binding MarR family transcriptional regulator
VFFRSKVITLAHRGQALGLNEDLIDRIQKDWLRERPGTPVVSIGVLTRIRYIAKLLDDDQRREVAAIGIDASTRDLLSTLRRAGVPYRLPAGEIARRSLLTAGAISQRVARAERIGLVRRRKAEGDARSVLVELTAAGHELIERTVDELLEHEEQLLSGMTPDQLDALTDLLRVLLGTLIEHLDPEGQPVTSMSSRVVP